MRASRELAQFIRLMDEYRKLGDRFFLSPPSSVRDAEDKENPSVSPDDTEHYMAVGYDAIRLILAALVTSGRAAPGRVLDFPSGSGRVTRHLRAMFPAAHLGACDLYEGHVRFCAEHFGAEPLLSTEDLDELDVGCDWDLIFCGSLLTHLPEELFQKAIDFIERSLSPSGLAIVTVEGRHAAWRQDNTWKFMEDDMFIPAREGVHQRGFGFADYDPAMKSKFNKQSRYGIALVKPSWVMRSLEEREGIRILGYIERGWDQHQDVVIFGKPSVNEGAPTPTQES